MHSNKRQSIVWLKQHCQQFWLKLFLRRAFNRHAFDRHHLNRHDFDRRIFDRRVCDRRTQNQQRWQGLSERRPAATGISASSRRFGLWSGLAVATLSVGLFAVGGWQVLELQSYNLLHRTRDLVAGAPNWDDRIAVIAIDDKSTKQLGRFPWPRETYTELLEQLQTTQPAAIAFDILFPDVTDDDADLAAAIVNSANVVLAVVNKSDPPVEIVPTIAEPAEGFFLAGDITHESDIDGVSRQVQLYRGAYPSLGLAALQVYAETMGSTTQADSRTTGSPSISPSLLDTINKYDKYGHRRSPHLSNGVNSLAVEAPQTTSTAPAPNSDSGTKAHFPSVSRLGSSSTHQDQSSSAPFGSASSGRFLRPKTDLGKRLSGLLTGEEKLWINWPGKVNDTRLEGKPNASTAGHLQTYSYVDVLQGKVNNSRFQNKIVFIGATASGIDPLRTPFEPRLQTGGVYIHAATVDNLLNASFLKSPLKWQKMLLLATLAIASALLLQRQGVYRRLAILVGFPLVWSGIAYGGFLLGWLLPVAAPLGTVALSGLAIQLREQQEKQQLMDIFSMNVSPGTADLIWQHKDAILHRGKLAAQTLTATVLFMDIRGFSSIAETLPSQQLLPWLNQYFETMTDCIMKHGGMVDKYIGDAIMAVFGAPLPRSTPEEVQADAIAALAAALEMHERLETLNFHLQRQNLPTIDFGIGIHTGSLIGGTVGSRHRLNYSVFGDTVNIAARIESMTKGLPPSTPFKILISADTCQHTQERFPVELFCSGNLRGRQGITDVYALADPLSSAPIESSLTESSITQSKQPATADRRTISA